MEEETYYKIDLRNGTTIEPLDMDEAIERSDKLDAEGIKHDLYEVQETKIK